MLLGRRSKNKLGNRRRADNTKDAKSVFSYYSSQSPEKQKHSTRNHDRGQTKSKIRAFIKHLPSIIALLAVIFCIGYLLSLSTNPRLSILNDSGVNLIRKQSDYNIYAHKLLSDSWWNLSKITIDTNNIEAKMKLNFPELSNVAVTLPIMGRRPVILLEISPPSLVIRSNGEDYLIDKQGRSMFRASEANPSLVAKLPLVVDKSDLEIQLGSRALTTTETSFISEIVAQLRAKNLVTNSIVLPHIPNELHVTFKKLPYLVKFDMLGDPKIQIGDYFALKRRLDSKQIFPSRYIDVRVEEKVYYK